MRRWLTSALLAVQLLALSWCSSSCTCRCVVEAVERAPGQACEVRIVEGDGDQAEVNAAAWGAVLGSVAGAVGRAVLGSLGVGARDP